MDKRLIELKLKTQNRIENGFNVINVIIEKSDGTIDQKCYKIDEFVKAIDKKNNKIDRT